MVLRRCQRDRFRVAITLRRDELRERFQCLAAKLAQHHWTTLFTLPLSSILSTDVLTVPPDATVSEFVYYHVLGRRERVVPVVSGDTFEGLARLDDIADLDREDWETSTVGECMATDLPVALPSWTLRDAVAAMESADIDVLAVTDAEGTFIGVVTADDILKLDEILDQTGT